MRQTTKSGRVVFGGILRVSMGAIIGCCIRDGGRHERGEIAAKALTGWQAEARSALAAFGGVLEFCTVYYRVDVERRYPNTSGWMEPGEEAAADVNLWLPDSRSRRRDGLRLTKIFTATLDGRGRLIRWERHSEKGPRGGVKRDPPPGS